MFRRRERCSRQRLASRTEKAGDKIACPINYKLGLLPAGFAPATATTAATVSAATATVAAATTETTALGAGTRFVYVQRAAVQFLAVEGFDGLHGFGLIGHFDKGEAARLAGVAITHYTSFFNGAVRGKRSLELGLRGLISKISNKDIRH